jgi:hypothetical protein
MKSRSCSALILIAAIAAIGASDNAHASLIDFTAAGTDASAIQATVQSFRDGLGTLNANLATSLPDGRREINWDGVPAALSSPNNFPGDFFNGDTPGRARGIEFYTPGTGFRVSSSAGQAPVEFGEIDALYADLFAPFSPQKLFTPLGSTITDVSFFLPGTTTPALTRGFGAVFSDVDFLNSTRLQFFDANGDLLSSLSAPPSAGNETFSFAGAIFSDPVVARVRITSGNQVLAQGQNTEDLVTIDDLVFGEPQRASAVGVPDSGNTLILLAAATSCLFLLVPLRTRKSAP